MSKHLKLQQIRNRFDALQAKLAGKNTLIPRSQTKLQTTGSVKNVFKKVPNQDFNKQQRAGTAAPLSQFRTIEHGGSPGTWVGTKEWRQERAQTAQQDDLSYNFEDHNSENKES